MGTPTYMPQNDPHDVLIILTIHKWGKNLFKKICFKLPSAMVRPGGRVRLKMFFYVFHRFLNSPRNSDDFEYRHIISNINTLKQKNFPLPYA